MKKIIFFIIAVFVATASITMTIAKTADVCLYSFYQNNLQKSLFSAFLTIGGFLFSLKTFILVKLKEGLFDSPRYKKRVKARRAINPNISVYGPLSRLSGFLVYCVFGSLITATYQFTFGFIRHDLAAAIGIASATTTLAVVFLAWWNIRTNLKIWFELLEEDAEEDEQK